MEKVYRHQEVEGNWYQFWEKKGYFTPKVNRKKSPFTIIMPPPNANGSLHIGHAMFLTLEDIMIRFHRMKGDPTLWLPGADHAGILTQVVFEKKLEKEEGKSRYDLGREEFFQRCLAFTLQNKEKMFNQMKALGASCDWKRASFTLEEKFNFPIYRTFQKLYEDKLLYRAERMINWCPRCATALSDLEVIYRERKDPLYFFRYGPLIVATVRPETKFGDTALAVHPNDKRYQAWIGKEIEVETLIGKRKLKIIADRVVDPKFGTGVVKVTPAHDATDFEIAQRHHLEVKTVIDFNARLNEKCGPYQGLTVKAGREKVVADLKKTKLLIKIEENYQHRVALCERCQNLVEPMVSLQWFIKTKPLAEKAIAAVKKGRIKIIPKRFAKNYLLWLENIKDWCISRQIWWGHRLPVWYCGKQNFSPLQLTMNKELKRGKEGCGKIIVSPTPPQKCPVCQNPSLFQDPDTLDTWFSSGQWPFTTLGWGQKNTQDFSYFYPTSVMETGYEILFFWVARMVMLGLYTTGEVPFKTIYLHGLVRDAFGEKMSKSKGNVIDPLKVIEKYGADSLRAALVFGTSPGADVKLSEEKIQAMRNFGNKLWNIGRFLKINREKFRENGQEINNLDIPKNEKLSEENRKILLQLKNLGREITRKMENYQFAQALQNLYQFLWHSFADKYLEEIKEKLRENDQTTLKLALKLYLTCLAWLHPFMPFITEEIKKQIFPEEKTPLIITPWPKI